MKKLLLLPFICITTFLSAQQVINYESPEYDLKDSAIAGDASIQFNYLQNQNTVVNVGNHVNLILKRGINTYLGLADLNFIQANGTNLDYNAYQHFRYKHDYKSWLSGEAFAQTQFNQLIGLKFRGLMGAGPRIRLLHADSLKCYIGPMWMYEYEESTDETAKNVHNRLSLYLSFVYFKRGNFNFDVVAYYQPDLIDPSNYRFLSEFKAEFQFNKHLAFRFNLSQSYTSAPPPKIPNNISNVRNAFVYKF